MILMLILRLNGGKKREVMDGRAHSIACYLGIIEDQSRRRSIGVISEQVMQSMLEDVDMIIIIEDDETRLTGDR